MNINTKAAVIYADQRENESRDEEEKKKKERAEKDDSILPVPFYVAVSVYAPDFSTYPRAFEVPPC